MAQKIIVETIVDAPVEKVWELWNEPEHIKGWAFASDDWEAPFAQNDVQTGGKFVTRMAAKDGSASFDFGGVYSLVIPLKLMEYIMGDGRTVSIVFETVAEGTKITETFEMESENSEDMQRTGWQSILDNFKKYAEAHA